MILLIYWCFEQPGPYSTGVGLLSASLQPLIILQMQNLYS